MKTRTDLLNHLIQRHNLKSYLEIGVQAPEINFNKIICPLKEGVDPDPNAKATYQMTSDDFFYNFGNDYTDWPDEYDLVFIDGLHTAEQVKKDFENALKVLSPNGFIVLHDCNPEKEEHTIVPRPTKTGHWNGDVYKFAANLICKKVTVDIDNGCLVYRNKNDFAHLDFDKYFKETATWDFFDKNRKELLKLITWDEFINLSSHV
jgi:hypothetical protein